MDNSYLHILQYLGYDIKTAQNRIEKNSGFRGDTMHMGFKYIIEQAETHQHTCFNKKLLILSDRLYGVAVGLHYYFRKCTDANVDVAYDRQEALAAADGIGPDYMILVGYLCDERNYDIIRELRSKENPPHIIMLAIPDQFIRYICYEYRIAHVFDRNKPVDEFVAFLKSLDLLPRV